jgi:hypothetical protein
LISDTIDHLLKPCQLEVGLNFSLDSTPGLRNIGLWFSLRSQSIDQKTSQANDKNELVLYSPRFSG